MKRILFILLAFVAFNASAQLPYPTNTFWQFLEGFQGGDSTTQNYMEYKNESLLMRRTGSDVKVFQVKNDVSNSGVLTGFLDEQKNGGFAVDSSDGTTVVKLRGGLDAHTYFMNNYFSIGRAGNSQQYGGTVDGARFTVNDGNRNPFTGLGSADNYQMMVQSSSDSLGKGAGIAFTNENAAKDVNVGGAIVYEKTGNNGKGALNFYAKESQGDLADPIKYLRLGGDTVSILSDNTKITGALNLEGLTVDNNADSVLLFSNDTVYKNSLSSISENIYNTDGTLTGDRTVTGSGNDLTFEGQGGRFIVNSTTGITSKSPSNATIKIERNDNVQYGANLSYFSGNSIKWAAGLSDAGDFTNSTGNEYYIGTLPTNPLFLIKTTGDVGIGTTAPSAQIHADNTATSGVGAIIENSNAANTDDIVQFQNSTGTVASITNEGYIKAKAIESTSDSVAVWSGDTLKKKELKNKTILSGMANDFTPALTTEAVSIVGGSFQSAGNRFRAAYISPSNGTLSDLNFLISGSQPADGSLVATVYVNDVATSLIVTVPANASVNTIHSNTADEISVNAGDYIYIYITNNSSGNGARIAGFSSLFQFD